MHQEGLFLPAWTFSPPIQYSLLSQGHRVLMQALGIMWGELISQGLARKKPLCRWLCIRFDRCVRRVSAQASIHLLLAKLNSRARTRLACRANTRLRPASGGWPSLDETGCNWCWYDEHRVSGWGEPLLQQGWQTKQAPSQSYSSKANGFHGDAHLVASRL